MNRWRVFLGFIAAVIYAMAAHVASWERLAAGMGLAFLGLLLRGWAAGYLEKGKRLAQDGPYSVWRHPLYVGSFLIALGFCWAGTSAQKIENALLIWLVFFFLFVWIYPRRIRDEEESLERYFGDAWREYKGKTWRFWPRLRPLKREKPDRFLWLRYKRNHEYNAVLGYMAGVTILVLKGILTVD